MSENSSSVCLELVDYTDSTIRVLSGENQNLNAAAQSPEGKFLFLFVTL